MSASKWMTAAMMREWCLLNEFSAASERRLESQHICVLSILPSDCTALNSAGITTVGQLVAKSGPELSAIASLDASGIERVEQALRQFVFGAIEERLRQVDAPQAPAPMRRRQKQEPVSQPAGQM